MKKLIVLSVVFALVASTAFAVDLGANVFGLVIPAKGGSGSAWDGSANGGAGGMVDLPSEVASDLGFKRVRLSGYGEAGDGAFGGQLRFEVDGMSYKDAFAFWKPIDQLKVVIGNNSDGWYGKEGVTGWGFNGNPYDGGVAFGGDKIWGADYNPWATGTRSAFFGGYGGEALHLNITPVDMVAINIAIPFGGQAEVADAFKSTFAQVDVNLDFGNIALSFQAGDDSDIFLYYGGSFGDLGLDVGFHYSTADDAPIGVGAGLKYATDAFGVKFRVVANLGVGDSKWTGLVADVLPYFSLGDNIVAFVNLGIGMKSVDGDDDAIFDWNFNPYIRIGEEWGAQFLIGVDVHSWGGKDGSTTWSIPIAIMVMF